MNTCRMILHHADGRIEETDVRGDGSILPGAFFRFGADAEQWWKVVRVNWLGAGGVGEADLEPADPPAYLASR